jgi:hypothetical protein
MTDRLNYSMGLSLEGGPTISADDHMDVEAFEKIEVAIPKSSVPTTVNVQPSLLTELKALIIISDVYTDLTFTVDAYQPVYTLDGPLMLVGKGNIGMLGATVNDLIFTNANGSTARNVTILVARDAVEEQGS